MATTDGAGSSCEDRFGLHQPCRKCSVFLSLVSKSPEVFSIKNTLTDIKFIHWFKLCFLLARNE
jgi:hypothetical protein